MRYLYESWNAYFCRQKWSFFSFLVRDTKNFLNKVGRNSPRFEEFWVPKVTPSPISGGSPCLNVKKSPENSSYLVRCKRRNIIVFISAHVMTAVWRIFIQKTSLNKLTNIFLFANRRMIWYFYKDGRALTFRAPVRHLFSTRARRRKSAGGGSYGSIRQ